MSFDDSHYIGIYDSVINNAGKNINNIFLPNPLEDSLATLREYNHQLQDDVRRLREELHELHNRLYSANASGRSPGGGGYMAHAAVGDPSCFNCGTSTSPLWRRDDAGNSVCNACGLYFKRRGTHWPKKTMIKRKKRVPAASGLGGIGASPNTTPRHARTTNQAVASISRQAALSATRLFVEIEEEGLPFVSMAAASANNGAQDGSDEADVVQQPQRKRARHSRQSGRYDQDDGAGGAQDSSDEADVVQQSQRKRAHHSRQSARYDKDGTSIQDSSDEADVVQQPQRKRARRSRQSTKCGKDDGTSGIRDSNKSDAVQQQRARRARQSAKCDRDDEHKRIESVDASGRISGREQRSRRNAAGGAASSAYANPDAWVQGFNRSASLPDSELLAHRQRSAGILTAAGAGAHDSPGLHPHNPYQRAFPGGTDSGGPTLLPLAGSAMGFTGALTSAAGLGGMSVGGARSVQMGIAAHGSHIRPGSTPSRMHSARHDGAPVTTPESAGDYGRPQPNAAQGILYPGADQAAASMLPFGLGSSRGTNLAGVIGHLRLGGAALLGMSALFTELDRLHVELERYKSEEDGEACEEELW